MPTILLGSPIPAQYFKGIVSPKISKYEMPSSMAVARKSFTILSFCSVFKRLVS